MHLKNLFAVLLLAMLAACRQDADLPTGLTDQSPAATQPATVLVTDAPPTATPLPEMPRLLTICMAQEPRSLFYYDAVSTAERGVLAAIYDGPFESIDFAVQPVIVEKMPALADGDALLQPAAVAPGDWLVDAGGQLVTLAEGIFYRPSGCAEQACAQTYTGDQPVQVDQLVLRFRLLTGLQWSDGIPLTAADSVYSYEVAHSLYPAAWPERVLRTQSYRALDEQTVEWIGVPGDQDGLYHTHFYPPLPQHAWGGLNSQELPSTELASRQPLGWGAYTIQEWVAGDHITLQRNLFYFRAAEGLPNFDTLVYRFVDSGEEALSALLAGECDLIDQTAMLESQVGQLSGLQAESRLALITQNTAAWDVLAFGITSLESGRPDYFGQAEVRRAVAQCIDRYTLAQSLSGGRMVVAESYVPPGHPLYNPEAAQYPYDPQVAADRLQATGWLDLDGDPDTPRTSLGVAGVPDGTAFVVDYLVSPDAQSQAAAQRIQGWLAACGIQADLVVQDPQIFLAAGPDAPVFGRQFDLAQFGWATAVEPPCDLYITNEIPGTYPEFSLGWGGVNAAGYSSAAYDQACANALYSLADQPLHTQAHAQAQALFAEELPALPLYWHSGLLVTRPDLCGISPASLTDGMLVDLEQVDVGEGCLGG
jgi:peptide/nickel transport system substrate-binding protein